MAQHNELGIKGEQAAATFMKSKAKILNEIDEASSQIDIIAEDEEYIIFSYIENIGQWGT